MRLAFNQRLYLQHLHRFEYGASGQEAACGRCGLSRNSLRAASEVWRI